MSTFFPKIGVFSHVHTLNDCGIHFPQFNFSFPNTFDKGMKVHHLPTHDAKCDSIENETLYVIEKDTHIEDIEVRIQKVASRWEISIKDATELMTTVDNAQSS